MWWRQMSITGWTSSSPRRRCWLLSRHGGCGGKGTQYLSSLLVIEASQLGSLALCVFAIDFDCARYEEILLLARARLPVVRLGDGDDEALAAGPGAVAGLSLALGRMRRIRKRLDARELLHVPCLANTEAAIVVLSRLVHAHAARRPHGDDDQTGLLVLWGAIRRRWCGGMGAIFLDPDVRDVAFGQLPIRVELREATLNDAALLVLESLGATHRSQTVEMHALQPGEACVSVLKALA